MLTSSLIIFTNPQIYIIDYFSCSSEHLNTAEHRGVLRNTQVPVYTQHEWKTAKLYIEDLLFKQAPNQLTNLGIMSQVASCGGLLQEG